MVKEFRVVLAPPPQNGYVTNSEVTGHVVLVTDEAKSGYKHLKSRPQLSVSCKVHYVKLFNQRTEELARTTSVTYHSTSLEVGHCN